MPGSFEAAAVVVIALLPGALYVWAFERQAGRWGIGLADRLLRFVGGSALFHAVVAPISYRLWADHWDDLRRGASQPPWLWLVVIALVGAPTVAGTAVGIATRHQKPWARWFTGPDPAPRAWDYLFQHEADGWVRCRLKSGLWIAGAYADANGRRSYAAGYGEDQDLFLAAAVRVDPVSGEFERDADDRPVILDGGLLLRWEEVEYLEFIDA